MHKIFYHKHNTSPWYVAKWTGNCWQQCSQYYFYRKCAERKLAKLEGGE